ncbi:MAG TPA: DUF3365 domain-containing protein [Candidatus Eisenbacteria bacterium]|nr:DUF3365 domain-containing protein [Candidatus Eisenbacteria bacterium]
MNRRLRYLPLALTALSVVGCQAEQRAKQYDLESLPPPLVSAVAEADTAMARLQRRLGARLKAELAAGGPVAALSVCRDSAQFLTSQVAAQSRVQVGRTSHRLRSLANTPRAWVRPYLEAITPGQKAAAFRPVAVDLGETVGLLRPIATQEICLQCHGDAAAFSPELALALREAYPEDRATSFAVDDLRGVFWAEVSKAR